MRVVKRLALLIFIIGTIAACSSEDEAPGPLPTAIIVPTATTIPATATPPPPPTNTPAPTALPAPRTSNLEESEELGLRIVQGIEGLPPADVSIQGLRFVAGLGFGRTTGISSIEAGEYPVTVSDSVNETVYVEQVVNFPAQETMTLILAGTPEQPTFITTTENTEPLNVGESRIQFVHAIADEPTLELYRTGQPFTAPVEFGSASPWQTVPSGPTSFSIQRGDDTLHIFELDLDERDAYTLIGMPDPDNPEGPQITDFSTRVPSLAATRVVNLSPDTGTVEVYFNDTLLATGLEYSRISETMTIPTANGDLLVYPPGADRSTTAPLLRANYNINPGDNLMYVITGTSDDLRIIQHEYDRAPTPTQQARIVFAHALSDAPRLEISADGTPLEEVRPLTYRVTSQPINLQADTYDFRWSTTDDPEISSTLETALNVTLEPGREYFYLLTGRNEDQPPIIFSEVVGMEEAVTVFDDPNAAQQADGSVRLRVVNLLTSGEVIDIYLEDLQIITGLNPGNASNPTIVQEGEYSLSANLSNTEEIITATGSTLTSPESYTAYVYRVDGNVETFVTRDGSNVVPSEEQASVRLVNIAEAGTAEFRLAYEVNDGPIFRPSPDPTTRAQNAGTLLDQDTIPVRMGMRTLTSTLQGGEASNTNLLLAETLDFYLIDTDRNVVTAVLEAQPLEPGGRYDIIADRPIGEADTLFVLSYAQP